MAKKILHRKISKKAFLEGVRERLENDVLSYFDYIKHAEEDSFQRTGKIKGIGFWASARLIFPPINAVSVVLYRSKEPKERRETDKFIRLLRGLGIKYPSIILEMYRHSLIHGDKPRGILYRGHKITWSIAHNGTGHIFHKDNILLDTRTLYNDFVSFLNKEIRVLETKQVWVENEIQFGRKIPSQLKKELQAITQC